MMETGVNIGVKFDEKDIKNLIKLSRAMLGIVTSAADEYTKQKAIEAITKVASIDRVSMSHVNITGENNYYGERPENDSPWKEDGRDS